MAIKHGVVGVLHQKGAELEDALEPEEVVVRVTEDKVELIKAKAEEEKAKAIVEARLKGIKEFKASAEFENEVTEGSLVAYVYSFKAYKACMGRMVPKLDLSRLRAEYSNSESEALSLDEDELA
ncbi:putative serine/threonine-protein kinase BLUS1-like [Cocos nucifera]|uniref:Putative serine/threonine-protein kinase BLUS1-like n=1 Tax=Cocos nucifera TaxID=13894 RepID=A0A8K0IJV7_COCNU|nr:putative serine/threonine-protein kinase BLUS1-like [Cocos nucifera]